MSTTCRRPQSHTPLPHVILSTVSGPITRSASSPSWRSIQASAMAAGFSAPTSGAWRAPARFPAGVNCESGPPRDPFEDAPDEKLFRDRSFHALMTYGIIMKTLARFGSLSAAASAGASAATDPGRAARLRRRQRFYSLDTQGSISATSPLPTASAACIAASPTRSSRKRPHMRCSTACANAIWTRPRRSRPASTRASPMSSPCSPFSRPNPWSPKWWISACRGMTEILSAAVTPERLRRSGLFGLAQEMGAELAGIHGQALRPVHRA